MFAKPNTLIYLQRSSLMLAGKRLDAGRLAFPDAIVYNLEVLDRAGFVRLVEQFLRDHAVHGRRILLVMDSSMLFQKTIALDQTGQPDLILKAFVDAMPFEPGLRACLARQTDAELTLYATNAELYAAITEAIHLAGAGKLLAITPGPAYALRSEDRNLTTAADHFFADTTVRRVADFRTATAV